MRKRHAPGSATLSLRIAPSAPTAKASPCGPNRGDPMNGLRYRSPTRRCVRSYTSSERLGGAVRPPLFSRRYQREEEIRWASASKPTGPAECPFSWERRGLPRIRRRRSHPSEEEEIGYDDAVLLGQAGRYLGKRRARRGAPLHCQKPICRRREHVYCRRAMR